MKQSLKRGDKNRVGAVGEAIVRKQLERKGFVIVETNYLRKWGEIDIVAREKSALHFVEVKTVSYGTRRELEMAISHGTWRPEENVHPFKISKLHRAVESWLAEKNYEGEWQVDIATVRIVPREKYASVKFIWNVVG